MAKKSSKRKPPDSLPSQRSSSGRSTIQPDQREKRWAVPPLEGGNKSLGRDPSLSGTRNAILPLIIFICCSILLCWNLDSKYLWQDEAATAVLGERMLAYGRPLGYDGKNLITMDFFRPEDELRTGDPDEAVRYFAARHEFKKDTTWTAHPWGSFAVAGISLALLGKNTLAARLPFALTGALLVALLFSMVREHFRSPLPGFVTVALLVTNTFWFLHMRQCRYYALSGLFLLITLHCYLRWQEGRRWGAKAFVASAWIWFQQDFGSPWPVLAILALDSVVHSLRDRQRLARTALVFGVIGITIAPFVFYYEMVNRLGVSFMEWPAKLWGFSFQTNQFLIPLMMIPLAVFFLLNEKSKGEAAGRRLVILSTLIICTFIPWMSRMAPVSFLRYIVPLASLGAIVSAYVTMAIGRSIPRVPPHSWQRVSVAIGIAVLLIVTNLLAWPAGWIVPEQYRMPLYTSSFIRPELNVYLDNLRGYGPDPNREAVNYLKNRLSPEDEVVCNYEDIPLMFYLKNPIRGGIGCFRLTDMKGAPSYAVLRMSALGITHRTTYAKALSKYEWRAHTLDVPDVPWGNNPDPTAQYTLMSAGGPSLRVYERVAEHQ